MTEIEGPNFGNDSVVLYQTEDGQTRLDVRLHEETVWLTPSADG